LRGKLFGPYKRQSRAEGKGEPKNRENESKNREQNREQKYKAKNQNTEKRRKSKGAGQIGVLA
jgi:hypothetical protein